MEIVDSLAAETSDLGKSFGLAQATLAGMQRELEALREALRSGKQREDDQARVPSSPTWPPLILR
jgi:Skp family chaperone for outer membrane proteins